MTTPVAPTPNSQWLSKWLRGEPHLIIGDGPTPYLRRWYLIPRNRWINVYLHHFLRSDDDRALHDHPWWFVSVILRGLYLEHSETADQKVRLLSRVSIFDVRSPYWRRCVAFRPAIYRHRVILPQDDGVEMPCWTLIVTGPKVRDWGFWCKTPPWKISSHGARGQVTRTIHGPDRFVPWEQFGPGGCGEP